jgi:hypothetical protein
MAFGGRRGSSRWGLPAVRSDALGKLGPSFGIGAGCGVGVGVGILGGTCLTNLGYSSASSLSAWTESSE